MKKIFIIFILCVSTFYANTHIDNAKIAKEAYLNGEYKKAFTLYEVLIKNGIVESNYYLGNMYYLGEGVEKDYNKALELFKIASNKGIMEATNNLGLMYVNGHGVKKDYKKAFELFNIAADNSELCLSYSNIGYAYSLGLGINKDYTKAIEYYTIACKNKCYDSCLAVGEYYERGISVDKNYTAAKKYYTQACNAGVTGACNDMKNLKKPKTILDNFWIYLFSIFLIAGILYWERKNKI